MTHASSEPLPGLHGLHGRDAAIARIVSSDDDSHVGMGIVIGPRRVLTCAHVVNQALGLGNEPTRWPKDPLRLEFPLHPVHSPQLAEVSVWHPIERSGKPGDAAVLTLLADEPDIDAAVGVARFANVIGRNMDGDPLSDAHGPAGPCSLFRLAPTCECQIGGGIGSNAGFTVQQSSQLEGIVRFAAAGGQIGYAPSLTAPREISATLKVGLEQIGEIELPMTVAPSSSAVLSGKAAGTFTNSGVLKLPRKDLPYRFEVSDVVVASDATGISLRGRAALRVIADTSMR